jgi:hypothetical protein
VFPAFAGFDVKPRLLESAGASSHLVNGFRHADVTQFAHYYVHGNIEVSFQTGGKQQKGW